MTPEQLIVELEAALHQGEGHDWRLLAPLVLDVLKSMQAAHERLTAERDVAREFYGEWRGIADQRQSDLDELRADAWAMICDATNDQNAAAENRARRDRDFREANRLVEDLRAELAKAGESIRAYERMIDDVAEKASALACEEVKAEFLRRDTIARLQAAEIEALKNELARLTTPRPIAEAPRDGTVVIGCDDKAAAGALVYWEAGTWTDGEYEYHPTQFLYLPLPEVKP